MYFYPCGALTHHGLRQVHSFWPLNHWVLSPEDLILYWKSRNFYHLSPKDPKFSYTTCHQKTQLKTPSFLSRKDHFFKVNFVTERPLLFKCLIYVSLYKSCAPRISPPPLSILSQSTSVSPTEVLHRSIMQGQRPRDTRRAVCTQSFPRQLYSRTHNARLKFRNKCAHPVATGLQKS